VGDALCDRVDDLQTETICRPTRRGLINATSGDGLGVYTSIPAATVDADAGAARQLGVVTTLYGKRDCTPPTTGIRGRVGAAVTHMLD
jgi:hypothetical protein